ncbi:MAG: hypothetical protein IT366_23950 [Candidatus Hydrogenedentes bacterium]|nr:hypothetical protein [Candidatus Hydrogenedentota bacterium]
MAKDTTSLQVYVPQVLNEKHKEAMRRIAVGQSAKDVAREMGISRRTISYVRNSPVGRRYITDLLAGRDEAVKDIATQLQELAPKAVATLGEALDGQLGTSAPDHMKLKAAESVLDRTGHGRSTKQEMTVEKHTTIDYIRKLAESGPENVNVRAYLDAQEAEFRVVSGDEGATEAQTTGKPRAIEAQKGATDTQDYAIRV